MTGIKGRLASLQDSKAAAESPDIEGYTAELTDGRTKFFPLSVALGIVMQGFTFKGFPKQGEIVRFEGADGMADMLNGFCEKNRMTAGQTAERTIDNDR